MSDEQTELLRAILAELKVQTEDYARFREQVLRQSDRDTEKTRQFQEAWYAEVRSAKRHRERMAGIFIVMSLMGMIVFAALWILWPLGR